MPTKNRLKSQSSFVTTDIQAENKVDAPYVMKLFRRTLYQTKSRFVRASIYPRKLKLVPDYEASDIILIICRTLYLGRRGQDFPRKGSVRMSPMARSAVSLTEGLLPRLSLFVVSS
jgi:hypothetical protein